MIEGAIAPDQLSSLQNEVVRSKSFPWYFYSAANAGGSEDILDWTKQHQDLPQLIHGLISPSGEINSDYTRLFLEDYGLGATITSIGEREQFGPIRNVYRFKANLLLPVSSEAVTEPHTDYDAPSISMLFYLNDSDGDTVFFDRSAGDDTSGMAEVFRITPKAGDVAIFDGRQYHSGTPPVKSRGRFVLSLILT